VVNDEKNPWAKARAKTAGPPDRAERFDAVGETLAFARQRNRPAKSGGSGCPILVEGIRDRKVLRNLGYSGQIELVNRGWNQGRLCAWLYETYGIRNRVDGGAAMYLLMDWDRTGGRLQRDLSRRLESFDILIDTQLRKRLSRFLTPETRTVEGLRGFITELKMRIQSYDPLEEE
jgi:5S rRNA maturation endonuclease (ribonuclease M5)